MKNIRYMKKTIVLFCLAIVVLTTSVHGVSGCGGDEKKQSPFVGTWDWTENVPGEQSFNIRIGERNDSLLFSISGVFFGGKKIHSSPSDYDWNDIPVVKIPSPMENVAKSKICEVISNFYFDPERMDVYNDVSFELLNDSMMLFILDDNRCYWPDTAIMKRRDAKNVDFSYEEEELMYRE